MTEKIKTRIVTQKEQIKIEAGTVLYFEVDYTTKGIRLSAPLNSESINYFRPLVDFVSLEKHEAFLETYKLGIEYCKKKLKERN